MPVRPPKKKAKLSRGIRFKTNDKFADLLRSMKEPEGMINSLPWHGEAMHPWNSVPGCWAVIFDHLPLMQYISEDYLDPVYQ